MKIVLLASLLLPFFAEAKAPHYPVDLDLQSSSRMYEYQLAKRKAAESWFSRLGKTIMIKGETDSQLDNIVKVGKRNLDWLIFMNQNRTAPLQFTIPGSLKGIPITEPSRYSDKIQIQKFNEYVAALPTAMKEILIDGKPFTTNPPMADADYTKLGNAMDKIYQNTLRWQLMLPYLSEYEQMKSSDIRGYYFLSQVSELNSKLKNFGDLLVVEKEQFREWLIGECMNSEETYDSCQHELGIYERETDVIGFHNRYVGHSKSVYDAFFQVEQARTDVTWVKGSPDLTLVPFVAPERTDLKDFLSKNIEDEWKWAGWQLRLDFKPTAAAHLVLQPGTTPHVNGIAGNIIYMDGNAPISEWDVQWTIRHEFGHVVGFPDCYVEFYDASKQEMVNYQLDITDLMCSRAGTMKERMFREMKKTYAQ